MHRTGAARRRAASPVGAVGLHRRLVLAALLTIVGQVIAAPFTLVRAQQAPMVQLSAFRYEVGDTLSLRASGLEPGGQYVVSLRGPDGSVTEQELTSGSTGNLVAQAVLDAPGTWTVGLTGANVSARLNVQVAGPPDAGGQADPGEDAQPNAPAEEEAEGPPAPGDEDSSDLLPAPGSEDAPPADDDDVQGPAGPGEAPGAEQDDGAGANGLPGSLPVPPTQARQIQVSLDRGDVVGRRNDVEAWRLTFPSGSGQTAGLLEGEDFVLVGHGNHLLQVDRLTGMVRSRDRLPAQIVAIGEDGRGLVVSVSYASGDTVELTWPPEAPMAFDPDARIYGWLRAEADVAEPAGRLAQDPTNPWLYLATARERPDQAETLIRGALAQARTFYEYAQLAGAIVERQPGQEELAAQAMYEALDDFVGRGYRGKLLLDPQLTSAYGFPHDRLERALDINDMEAADFWAPWVYRLGSGGTEPNRLLNAYAAALNAQGDEAAAADWRARAAVDGGSDAQTTVERAAVAVGSTGWYGVVALLVAIVALHLTLAAKYWRAQSLVMRQRRESGRTNGRLARAFGLRYATFTEKLVILLLFAAMVAVAALAGWASSSSVRPAGLGSGSLATPTSRALLAEAAEGPDRAFALAYAAQTAGDLESASSLYRDLSADADAMNNLGVLRQDPELFRLALELQPGHAEAAFNLDQAPNPSRLMQTYRPQEPLLAVPDEGRLTRAFSGGPWASLGAAFTNPFVALRDLDIQPAWLWTIVVVLFLAWVAWTVLSLFVPRPGAARNAPRTFLYHLLALLLPGSGLADELWGVLLLVPWAIFGIDLILHLVPLGVPPAIAFNTDVIALVLIYAINTIAFVVEFSSYRRRMRDLRADHPELATAYGIRP
ncbi:MAG TPA: hypothetical protein VFF10_08055 [Trueperaceae bacterium]|nr:hypothetical protein [Trueperaceae bacterium]